MPNFVLPALTAALLTVLSFFVRASDLKVATVELPLAHGGNRCQILFLDTRNPTAKDIFLFPVEQIPTFSGTKVNMETLVLGALLADREFPHDPQASEDVGRQLSRVLIRQGIGDNAGQAEETSIVVTQAMKERLVEAENKLDVLHVLSKGQQNSIIELINDFQLLQLKKNAEKDIAVNESGTIPGDAFRDSASFGDVNFPNVTQQTFLRYLFLNTGTVAQPKFKIVGFYFIEKRRISSPRLDAPREEWAVFWRTIHDGSGEAKGLARDGVFQVAEGTRVSE